MGKSTAVIADEILCDDARLADSVKCTLPELKWKTSTLSGSGVGGDVEIPLQGLAEAMNTQVDLRAVGSENAAVLLKPGLRQLEYRFKRNIFTDDGRLVKAGTKVYMSVLSTSLVPGGVERGATMDGNATFSVLRYRYVEDGKELWLIDQINEVYKVGGVDYSDMYRL